MRGARCARRARGARCARAQLAGAARVVGRQHLEDAGGSPVLRVGFYIDREVKITTFAGFAQCANPADAKFAHSAAEIDDVDLWAALELLDLPPPPWAAVRQPARARLAAAGAAQTMITLQASSMARAPHRMGGIAAARGRGMVLSIMFLSPQPRSASVVKRSLSMAARKNGRHGAACCVLLPAPQGVPTSRRHCSHHRYSQGFLRRADIPFSS